MSEYHISRILPDDKRGMRQLDELLQKEGIERDRNLDYTVGLFDDDYRLAATGSCFKNTLRCMAVDSSHQGEGLLNQVVTHLVDYEYHRGFLHLFLYTKCDTAPFFKDLGFYEIARVAGRVVFMENRKQGFSSYLERLKTETALAVRSSPGISIAPQTAGFVEGAGNGHAADSVGGIAGNLAGAAVGAVVMNANPFTLGHQYLLETASASVDLLHVFVVSEDASLVPASVRFCLVQEGAAYLKNLVFHRTDSYMISNATFPSYFLRDEDAVIRSHARLDIAVFQRIAEALQITDRFVGEEPASQVTGIYNQVMEESLREAGLTCHVIPRKAGPAGAISASTVRGLIHDGRIGEIRALVPDPTYRYLTSPEAARVIQNIREAKDVVHY